MKRESVKRVLPADVYDALELSALAFGGIGAGRLHDGVHAGNCPVCIYGHAIFANNCYGLFDRNNPIETALDNMGKAGDDYFAPLVSDGAVLAINSRLGRPANSRVTFKEWCKELNVTRAASEVVPK